MSILWLDFIWRYYSVFMYEREENAQFSLISYSKERRFRVFQTLPDSWKNKKLLQVLRWFLKLVYYRDYLGKRWRNSKIHDCQPVLENYRHWLLKSTLDSLKSVFNVFRRKPSLGAPDKGHLIPENTFLIYYNLMAKGFT